MGDYLPGTRQCDPYTMPHEHSARCARVAPDAATPSRRDDRDVSEVLLGGSQRASDDIMGLPDAPGNTGASQASYPHSRVRLESWQACSKAFAVRESESVRVRS